MKPPLGNVRTWTFQRLDKDDAAIIEDGERIADVHPRAAETLVIRHNGAVEGLEAELELERKRLDTNLLPLKDAPRDGSPILLMIAGVLCPARWQWQETATEFPWMFWDAEGMTDAIEDSAPGIAGWLPITARHKATPWTSGLLPNGDPLRHAVWQGTIQISQLMDSAEASAIANAHNAAIPAWQPMATAPKDGRTRIIIAQFRGSELVDIDFDAVLERESESWEMPEVYYVWKSAWGRIEEPTHWMILPPLPATPEALKGKGN
jgi:hypothetical protein